ncbi:hypothetical protein LBMAG53_39010 [Planctomycetota bacterium]|nr:hypothetical protein LBMAG53_39010 [Planctomycetota bacterium]
MHLRHAGRISAVLNLWETTWAEARDAKRSGALPDRLHSQAARLASELALLYGWLGRTEQLKSLLSELETSGFPLEGATKQALERSQMQLLEMIRAPEIVFRCGPWAVNSMCQILHVPGDFNKTLRYIDAESRGTNLLQLKEAAASVGLMLQGARMGQGAVPIAPAVTHWKVGHFGLIVKATQSDNLDDHTCLIRDNRVDPRMPNEYGISLRTLAEESSGVFLISAQVPLPVGWTPVEPAELAECWGRGCSTGRLPPVGPPPSTCPCPGMPVPSIDDCSVTLKLDDIPLAYAPPIGPAVEFQLRYTQDPGTEPATFSFGNIGHRWTHTWINSIVDDPTVVPPTGAGTIFATAYQYTSGGQRSHTIPLTSAASGWPNGVRMSASQSDLMEQATLSRTGAASYEYVYANGSKCVYGRSDGSVVYPRRIFITAMVDPAGNALSFSYDASQRLIAVTDAIGQVTTLYYDIVGSPLLLTRVVDPFGRTATIAYTNGKVTSITDVQGMASSLSYIGSTDVLASLTTPYGTSTFTVTEGFFNTVLGSQSLDRSVTIADPDGEKQKVEINWTFEVLTDPVNSVPVIPGVTLTNAVTWTNTTWRWDRKAMKLGPNDPTKAHRKTWALDGNSARTYALETEKAVYSNRVWYKYPGQVNTKFITPNQPYTPIAIARVTDDGSTQLTTMTYDGMGRVLTVTDPMGRTVTNTYDGPVQVGATISDGSSTSALFSAVRHPTLPVPQSLTDANGRTTTYTYNAAGQVTSITLPQRPGQGVEQTVYAYNATGYLQTVTAPGGAQTTYTYDGLGRVRTVTGADGYALTMDYDNLDRVTQVTYPDGTTEQVGWTRLDPEWARDRLGKWSRQVFNVRRQVIASQDVNGQVTAYQWCRCGGLKAIFDANGGVTEWEHDLDGRVVKKIFPDGKAVTYGFKPASGYLDTITDAKGQIAAFSYLLDGSKSSLTFSNAVVATPAVSWTYDTFGRLKTMTDGTGITTYSYNPSPATIPTTPTTGAGQLASIDGPLGSDTITSSYDAWDRQIGTALNGIAGTATFDPQGRISQVVDDLGTTAFSYVGLTSRLAQVTRPGGVVTAYTYQPLAQHFRMQQLLNRQASGTRISEFNYGYTVDHQISQWTQQADAQPADVWNLGNDAIGQLTGQERHSGTATGALVEARGWKYDPLGNRLATTVTIPPATMTGGGTFNALNQLTATSANGAVQIDGHLDEPGTVLVNGQAAAMRPDKSFTASFPLVPGQNTFTVQATDLRGNVRTGTYRLDATALAAARTFTYDANGNCLTDSVNAYTWDAADRLVRITSGTGATAKRSEFTYDGLGRRVRIQEYQGTPETLVSDTRQVWVGSQIAEERSADGTTVLVRYTGSGMRILSGTYAGTYLFLRDHLGSVREVVTTAGLLKARYAYSAWGERTRVAGVGDPAFPDVKPGYTGHFHHAASGLVLTWYRAYDPVVGRWLSRDPIGESGGMNLYGYVGNSPISLIDPLGLWVYVTYDHYGLDTTAIYYSMDGLIEGLRNNDMMYRSIKKIEIHGHSNDCFGYYKSKRYDGKPMPNGGYSFSGNDFVLDESIKGADGEPIFDLLPTKDNPKNMAIRRKYLNFIELIKKYKLHSDFSIILGGCGSDDTAKKLSMVWPGVPVRGNVGNGYVFPTIFDAQRPNIYWSNWYLNGKLR